MTGAAWSQDCPGPDCAVVRQDGVTGTGIYATIGEAVAAAATTGFENILVYPGRYEENFEIAFGTLTIRSLDGPLLTCINGPAEAGVGGTVVVRTGAELNLIGFTVSGASSGVVPVDGSTVRLYNNVLSGNQLDGLTVFWTSTTVTAPTISVINCVLANNGRDGVSITVPLELSMIFSGIHNNIFSGNSRYGLGIFTASTNNASSDTRARLSVTHNIVSGSGSGNYSPLIVTNGSPATGQFNVSTVNYLNTSPGFVNSASGCGPDVRLITTSAAINTGWDASQYRDIDGTRNDLGVFGGPYAAGYFNSSNDGPVVRDLEGPTAIRVGDGTFTVRGKAASRP